MARRKHRRKYSKEAVCGCPKGTKKVSTCTTAPNGSRVCRGRGFGCIGVGLSKKGKPTPRWFPMECKEPVTTRVPRQADRPSVGPKSVPPPKRPKRRKGRQRAA